MKLRPYRPDDLPEVIELFRACVHSSCRADYTPAQLDAWAPENVDKAAWGRDLAGSRTLVAEEDGRILGFANALPGYLDRLYVRRDCQGRGVASALCDALEQGAMMVHASQTAKGFFLRRGYRVVESRQVERLGQWLAQYVMRKEHTMKPEELIALAEEAMRHAYVPYSHYQVGAALLCGDGAVYQGCNIENASYTPTVCAERSAFFKAVYDGHRAFSAIAVVGGKDGKVTGFFPPCGVCRQVMREFCTDEFQVLLAGPAGVWRSYTLAELLPVSFSAEEHMHQP